jgi:hypothetical protein
LIEHTQASMELSAVQPDGSTLRQHLQVAAAAGATPDPRLAGRPPAAAAALWDAFLSLNAARPAGLAPSAITPADMLAWQQLHGVRFTAWEVDTLQAMDRAALATAAQHRGH